MYLFIVIERRIYLCDDFIEVIDFLGLLTDLNTTLVFLDIIQNFVLCFTILHKFTNCGQQNNYPCDI